MRRISFSRSLFRYPADAHRLSTYLALRLAADKVDGLWVGALMAANYSAWCWAARSVTG